MSKIHQGWVMCPIIFHLHTGLCLLQLIIVYICIHMNLHTKAGSHYVAQAGLEPVILLLQPTEWWNYRCASSYPAFVLYMNCKFTFLPFLLDSKLLDAGTVAFIVISFFALRIRQLSRVPVAHTCNSSYVGGRDHENHCSKSAWANSSRDPILKIPITKKGLMGWLKG
jgi:hypothetical protein